MLHKILIANRGEIACRIMRTAQRLGINCVAIYSEADANAQHVKLADEAYCVGPAASQASYLQAEKILKIAQESGAEAIHPGYGFLSENAEFAEACEQAGIIFIGPTAAAIRQMGSKSAAKTIMQQANVPVTPGYHGADQTETGLLQQTENIGYPVLLKASAGGGGKGMRVVWETAQFAAALASAKREAISSFGDDHILIEKYLKQSRHIEMQIFADKYGNVVHLFERDCSIQRRHQKVLEEAPAPHISATLREKLGIAATNAARAIDYVGAGTIEFLVDDDENFYFMEMNTRLQVEHPITEMITQQDLVEWQLNIAAGLPLPVTQEQLYIHGHAIEVRIYAEDPQNDFLPSIGNIVYLTTPPPSEHVRLETGITQHDSISPYYDPMLAKLIVWDHDRSTAIQRLIHALQKYHLLGVKSNIQFLQNIAEHAEFQAGYYSTDFIPKAGASLLNTAYTLRPIDWALAALFYLQQQMHFATNFNNLDAHSPWHLRTAWRNSLPAQQTLKLMYQQQLLTIQVEHLSNGYELQCGSHTLFIEGTLENTTLHAHALDQAWHMTAVQQDQTLHLFSPQQHLQFEIYTAAQENADSTEKNHNLAPMPGTIIAVLAQTGQLVKRGDTLLIMEAMKMEHSILAPQDGTVGEIFYKVGDQVAEGSELLNFIAEDE